MVENGLNYWLWLQEKRLEFPLSVDFVDQRSPDVSRVDDTKRDVRDDTHSNLSRRTATLISLHSTYLVRTFFAL